MATTTRSSISVRTVLTVVAANRCMCHRVMSWLWMLSRDSRMPFGEPSFSAEPVSRSEPMVWNAPGGNEEAALSLEALNTSGPAIDPDESAAETRTTLPAIVGDCGATVRGPLVEGVALMLKGSNDKS